MDNNSRLDSLPNEMASLDLFGHPQIKEETVKSLNATVESCRTLRKRITPNIVTNRRVILKPQKRPAKLMESDEDIKNFYCNQKLKISSQTLETIFEEPKSLSNDATLLIGVKKLKRSLSFQVGSTHTKNKIKKRRSKIKRLLGNRNVANRKKLSMQTFLKNLQSLDADDVNPFVSHGNADQIDEAI